jgi:hypothetical protein
MPFRQISQSQIPNADAHQPLRSKSETLQHAANLAINSLLENNAQFRRGDLADVRDASAFAVEDDAAKQLLRKPGSRRSIQRHLVFLFDFETRMGQTLNKIAVIREQEQSFAWRIEPADVSERREFRRKQIEDLMGRVRIAPRANKTGRFVQRQINVGALAHGLAIHFDVIGHRRLKMKIGTWFPIHRYVAAGNKLVRVAPRSYAGRGEETVQAHVLGGEW